MTCRGNLDDHCCWLGKHGVCSFLNEQEPDENGRRWVCSLRARLGSWERVHVDPRYLDSVKPKLVDIGVGVDCGDWPTPGQRCGTCGVIGDG